MKLILDDKQMLAVIQKYRPRYLNETQDQPITDTTHFWNWMTDKLGVVVEFKDITMDDKKNHTYHYQLTFDSEARYAEFILKDLG